MVQVRSQVCVYPKFSGKIQIHENRLADASTETVVRVVADIPQIRGYETLTADNK